MKLQKCYPPLKLRVFVDDIKGPLMEKNKEVAEMTKKVMKRLREDEKKGLMKRERQEKDDCIVWLPGSRAASMQQGRRSDGGKQCGNAGSRLENLGAKEKARRKKCKVRFSLVKKNEAFQKNNMKVRVKKLL